MKIQSVVPSKHIKDRFIVTMEDETVLKVTLNQVADYSLFSGRELDDEEYAGMKRDADISNAHALALRILGARNMSKSKMIERLIEKGEDPDAAEETADWLEKIGAINDSEYAALIVSHYSSEGYGTAKIKDELYRRGIPNSLWDDALSAMPDMSDKVYDFIKRKLDGAPYSRELSRKAANAAMRRGFSWDEIRSALSRYENEVSE